MNELERNTWETRYSYCSNCKESEDVIFVYPSNFRGDPCGVRNYLQKIMSFGKKITELNPTIFFRQRTVVGYRHPSNENGKQCQPGWLPNWVNIPWNALDKIEEPMDMCTHELIHPFFRCSPLHYRNEGWGEGFCDFQRGLVKKYIGLRGEEWWNRMIKAVEDNEDGEYHYPAGKFILKAYEEFGDESFTAQQLINKTETIRKFVQHLFSNFSNSSLSHYIEPSEKMKNKWQRKNKI